jgi:uncharacterized membrane protein
MPVRISAARLSWLTRESDGWRAAGLVDDETRARILGHYQAISTERRSLIALVVVAVLMCGIGLLLLIGYNWDRIPPAAKIGAILSAVAAAFAGSAAAYGRERRALGETLAFAGTLIFGNGIWLIAQVLHIQGHFPDAFFWFGVGALASAWLVESKWIGIAAVVLFALWLFAEGAASGFESGPVSMFAPIWAFAVWLAYRGASPAMLCVTALTGALWVTTATSGAAHDVVMPAAVVLYGCALFAARRWPRGDESMRLAWRIAGLTVLLIAFVPLMVTAAHRSMHAEVGATASLLVAIVVAVVAIAGVAVRPTTSADAGVAVVAAVTTTWAAAVWSGVLPEGTAATRVGTVLFSALAVGMGLALIHTALRSHQTADLAFGVLFALAFLVVRWVSVIENLLWSGAFLLVTGGGLLFVARLWRSRRPLDPGGTRAPHGSSLARLS